jgi:hypothetical protein
VGVGKISARTAGRVVATHPTQLLRQPSRCRNAIQPPLWRRVVDG